MRYASTRSGSPEASFRTALLAGLAPDGGLYVPTTLPMLPDGYQSWDYVESLTWSLEVFGADAPGDLVRAAAARLDHPDVPAPLVEVGDRLVFELFWGPTLSFKDHAMGVLGRLLGREGASREEPAVVLGATSGDTGSAAIEACRANPSLRVVILYPEGMVSEFQRRQMTTVADGNVSAVAVRGTFDDCQALVKQAFASHPGLLAVNSINWARIAAQIGYYIYLGGRVREPFDVVVPTGNFGNALSCWYAKQMGVPIETITLANNANHLLASVVNGETGLVGQVVATLAPAMDIAVPSNWERFNADPVVEFSAGWATDAEITRTMSDVHRSLGYLLDPHTAAAWKAGSVTRTHRPQVIVGTAHPAKSAEAVFDAVGAYPEVPAGHRELVGLPERLVTIDAKYSDLEPLIR